MVHAALSEINMATSWVNTTSLPCDFGHHFYPLTSHYDSAKRCTTFYFLIKQAIFTKSNFFAGCRAGQIDIFQLNVLQASFSQCNIEFTWPLEPPQLRKPIVIVREDKWWIFLLVKWEQKQFINNNTFIVKNHSCTLYTKKKLHSVLSLMLDWIMTQYT